MAKILDIEKISEIGKIDIPNLKLILRELLNDIVAEQEQSEDFKVDLSVILKLLNEKGLISEDEFNSLKDKVNSLIDSNKLDDAFNSELSEEAIEEIIKKSKFKGFFPTYNDLINKFPISKANHGDFAYIKDFNADSYNVNNIEEFIFDVNYNKWMSASDTTHLRNVYIREDEIDRFGEPLDNDLLQYNQALKRWICKTWDEADVARKSHLDFHVGNQIKLTEDVIGINDGSIKDNGRLVVELNTEVPNDEPMHISKNTFKQLLEEIDKDYFTKVHIGTEVNEIGVERIVVLEDDNDKYGNAIRRNITNDVIRTIINDMYSKLLDTFDIKKDPISDRLININDTEPAKYVPHGINTYNVDKIISAIDRDYNNAFTLADKKESSYADILKRVLTGYKELNITDDNVQPIISRLTTLYQNKNLWDRYSGILEHEKNKNITPEVFNELIDLLHYLYISKDLVRDEILERDITVNGIRTYTNDVKYTGNDKTFTGEFSSFKLTNKLANTIISSGAVTLNNPDGLFKVMPPSEFVNDVVIKGNLTVKGTTTEVNTVDLNISDNVIVLNKGENTSGVSRRISGIKIDRGQSQDKFFGYDEDRKRLIFGNHETDSDLSTSDFIAMIPNSELDITKPVVYNPKTKFLENSEMLRTDINGATSFVIDVPNNTLSILDPVYFDGEVLKKCNYTSFAANEIIGVVGDVNGNSVKVVTNGFIKTNKLQSVVSGSILYLGDGVLSDTFSGVLRRKVAIKIPNGIIVDIQKNSAYESEEYLREQIIHKVLEPKTKEVLFGYDFLLTWNTKFFADGILLIENINYTIDKMRNSFVLIEPFEHQIDLVIIKGFRFGSNETDFVTNEEVDNMFQGLDPLPPYPNAEYMENYEVDRIFGIMTEETPGNPVMPIADWCSDEQVNAIFGIREQYQTYDLKTQTVSKRVVVHSGHIHYFTYVNEFDKCDFVSVDSKGIINKLSRTSSTLLGVVQDKTLYDNGIIEYKIITDKVVPYDLIPISAYENRYGFSLSFGDKLYIGEKINKFSGIEICSFSNVSNFLEFKKPTEFVSTTKQANVSNNIELIANKYYTITTERMSINSIDLFEIDSPNFCKLNLINNVSVNEKNLYYDFQIGKPLVEVYRDNETFVIKPIRNLKCKTDLVVKNTTSQNLIRI